MRRDIHVLCLAFVVLLAIAAAPGSAARDTAAGPHGVEAPRAPASSALVKRVTIGGTRYWVINAVRAAGYIRSPYAKVISALIRACQTAGSWGFSDRQNSDFGVVAYLPTNPARCYGVTGGGPQSRSPCAQFYRTPDLGWWVAIAGTSTDICADMSTQVPGGRRATTTDDSDSGTIGAGTNVWVTCQEVDQGLLWDYVTPRTGNVVRFPLSRRADWIIDQDVDTGYPTGYRGFLDVPASTLIFERLPRDGRPEEASSGQKSTL